jgi:hypothetical protein
MCLRSLAFALASVVLVGSAAIADQGFIPSQPKPKCDACEPPQQRLIDLEAERADLIRRIDRAKDSVATLQAEIDADTTYAENVRADKLLDTSTPQSPGTLHLRQVQQRIIRNSMLRDSIKMTLADYQVRLREVDSTLLPAVREELRRCDRVCSDSPAQPDGPVTAGDPPSSDSTPATPVPVPRCELCEPPVEELTRLEEERRQLRELTDRLDREIRELEAENAREQRSIEQTRAAGKDPKYADHQDIVDEITGRAQQRIDANNQAIEVRRGPRGAADRRLKEIDQRVPQLRNEVYKCNSSCRVPTKTKWTLIGGGAAVASLLATTGGDSRTVTSTPASTPTPVTTLQPQPTQPPPAPQPPTVTEPAPTIAGTADCVECRVASDLSNHNFVIRLCDQAGGPWEIAVASISIRHAPPFVSVEGAQYDQASGNFRGATRGMVAGIPNVGIEIAGTADPVTGRVRFIYTMGTGGELPGRAPISYEITLQKRR